MKTLYTFLIFLFTLGLVQNGIAQEHNPEVREKIKAQKIAFITGKLSLSPDEATRFWPVYNQMEKEIRVLRKEQKKYRKSLASLEGKSDAEIGALLDNMHASKIKEIETRKKYDLKFRSILSVKKSAMLLDAEHQFKRQMIGEIRKNMRREHPPKRGQGRRP